MRRGRRRRATAALPRRPLRPRRAERGPHRLSRRRVLLLFVDGVGVGPDVPATNPFAGRDWPGWEALLGSVPVARAGGAPGLDAVLGVPGLPQSGTGQTAIMTGVNAPAVAGGHQGPYPTARMQALLGSHGVPSLAQAAGLRVALANAYPDAFLRRLAGGGGRLDAVARAMVLAGVRLRGEDDLRRGDAVSASITGHGWRERLGIDVPLLSEAEAGARLAALAARHDLTVYAHWATDATGHRGSLEGAIRTLERYDAFLAGLLAAAPPGVELVLVSDHGNIEDISHGRHTANPALAAWRGGSPPARWAALTDVAPAIRAALGVPEPEAASVDGPPALD